MYRFSFVFILFFLRVAHYGHIEYFCLEWLTSVLVKLAKLALVTYPAHTEASKARKDETSNGLTYEGCFYAGLSLLDQKQVYIS
jgi:hypothetical protein